MINEKKLYTLAQVKRAFLAHLYVLGEIESEYNEESNTPTTNEEWEDFEKHLNNFKDET